ncbi:serine/threonine-protein kinase [Leptolyngbya sp. FACHB-261]|uniref:serine/threonine protein kinase n=1 Tax=Leptolyngbya sp. FACHB-261 TaxID=2692806 RepID=UPI00168A02F8|nr:serine/threonine-protein kinase [Leptolyngbya sp. FACHB-261]MBD2102658.1 serine/threonine protein kinase [Leptolyngbya sp. FACHB-261]
MAEFDGSAGSQFVNQILHERYQIQALLGRKLGRQTFLALDLQNQLPVVIKLLLFSPDFTWEELKLFEREAETLKALDHPAIPQYLDFFEVKIEFGKGFALVQSYIEARSLQQWLQDGCRFSEAELMGIAKALLDILAYLHGLQPSVIHRDLKPSNVLLKNRSGNSPGEVYLIDFGSVQTAAHGGTVTVVGTYGYMPPEQFGGRSLPASDLYGVGMTLIYLATGQHPADLPQNDLHVEFKHLTTLSGSFSRWLEWLTNPSLTQRPASAQDARLHLLQPRPEPKMASTVQKIHLGTTTRPASSAISLEATQTTLQLKVPAKQIHYFSPVMVYTPSNILGCMIIASIFGWAMSMLYIYFWFALLPLFILVLIFLELQTRRPPKNTSANVIFQKKARAVIVTLNRLKETVTFQGRLIGLSVSAYKILNHYLLHLKFSASNQMMIVKGDRREIEWLCNELSEWAGIQVKPWK